MVVGRLAPHTILASESTLATYSNYPLCRLLPPLRRHHRLHAPSDSKSWNRSSETHLHHQIIKQSHNTAPNTTTNHLITISYLMSMILNLIFHSFSTLPLTISSSCSSTPPSFQPLKSPFATPTYRQQRRRKQQHRCSQASYGSGKRAPAYQLLAQSGPGLSALPWLLHGARNGLCP